LIFIVSFFFCVFALLFERLVGIDWDFHPDVITYTTTYTSIVEQGLASLPNQMYYFIADLAQGNVAVMIFLNILAYCLTNVILAKEYKNHTKNHNFKKNIKFLLLVLLIFAPYRLHLAIHALKDTLIIFMLCVFAAYQGKTFYSLFSIIPLLLLRIYAFFYGLLFIQKRLLIVITGVAVASMFFIDFSVLEFLQERNEAGMNGRDFDRVPTFSELGILGTIIRMIVWPMLAITGAFVVLSPSLLFVPVAFEAFLARVWSRQLFGHLGVSLGFIICLSVIAAFVDAFTAYLRYIYPAMVVMPLIFMRQSR
jgi:hypothetical protein